MGAKHGPGRLSLVEHRLAFGSGELRVHQPSDAAELPDDGPIEWAPLVPYWSVLWRSGVALAHALDGLSLEGLRAVELGCGLGLPSLVAARAGAQVLSTDHEPEALELLERNARENGVELATEQVDWDAPDRLVERAPFDLVLAADVVYERSALAILPDLLGRLGSAVWLADPGRPMGQELIERLGASWSVETDYAPVGWVSRMWFPKGSRKPQSMP